MNKALIKKFDKTDVQLVAVSKTRSVAEILKVYNEGVKDFGENRVQELLSKRDNLPDDIKWHLIGHLQSKKVKSIIEFIHLIHSVDRLSLLKEIQKQSAKQDRQTKVLLQFKVAVEATKHGFTLDEFMADFEKSNIELYPNIEFCGVMAMASFVSDQDQIKKEFQQTVEIFKQLSTQIFDNLPSFKEISMGMSGDFQLAIEKGSTMVRIGSLLFNS